MMIATEIHRLPVKYALGVYKEMPGFPTHEDLAFMLISNLEGKNKLEQPFVPSEVWPYMKDAIGTIVELQEFLDYASDETSCPGHFLRVIGKTGGKKPETQYLIAKNPWSKPNAS